MIADIDSSALCLALGTFLSSIHSDARESRWYRFYEHKKDNPDDVSIPGKSTVNQEERAKLKQKKSRLNNLRKMSLHNLLGISHEEYNQLLIKCGIMVERGSRWGIALHFKPDVVTALMSKHNITGYELESARPRDSSGRVHYLRLGPKQTGYITSAQEQVICGSFDIPRYNDFTKLRRTLRAVVRGRDVPDPLQFSSDDEESDDGADSVDDTVNSETESSRANDSSQTNKDNLGREFPMLHNLGINLDLTVSKNAAYVKGIIGELFALQLKHSPTKKSTNTHFRHKSTHSIHTISVPAHTSEDAYDRYHRKFRYFEELFEVIEMSPNTNGPTRLAAYIAKKYPEVYISVGKKNKMTMEKEMDEIEAAAMWRDARVLDWQAKTVLRHLRFHFKHKITVPFDHIVTILDGYTRPKVKVFEHHVDGEKNPEIVHSQYQSVCIEMKKAIEDIIAEYKINIFEISKMRLVLGGDHGQGAFRLCFRIILNVDNRDGPIYATKSIGEVYSAKEEGIILEETIMPWLEKDLQEIYDSVLKLSPKILSTPTSPDTDSCLVIRSHNGSIVCDTIEKANIANTYSSTTTKVMPAPEIFIAGDFCYFAYLLGKEGMSSKWCPYCPLDRHAWSLKDHTKPPMWTIDQLIEMSKDKSKTGAQRLGVKCEPKFKFIPIGNYVLPVTHAGLGVDNDIIELFESEVNARIVPMPVLEAKLRQDYLAAVCAIDDSRLKLKEFGDSSEGTEWKSLESKIKGSSKVMTEEEMQELTELDQQRSALALARSVAKRGKDSTEIEATTEALAIFTASKTGGKRRTNLMTKRRGCQAVVIAQDIVRHKVLSDKKNAIEKIRDTNVEKRKNISKKLEANTRAKRKDGNGWFIPMDRIFVKHGVKREDYHKRKFSGGPLKRIKETAKLIFDDAKILLRNHKRQDLDDSAVDIICDKTATILTASLNLFEVLLRSSPAASDIAEARLKLKVFMELYRGYFQKVTPKAHALEDHMIDQYITHLENGLPLVIEQFVERNHQDGKRHDEQVKRIKDPQIRADNMAKRKYLDDLAVIKIRQKAVRKSKSRVSYGTKAERALRASKRKGTDLPSATLTKRSRQDSAQKDTALQVSQSSPQKEVKKVHTISPISTKTVKRGNHTHHIRVLKEEDNIRVLKEEDKE